MEIVIRKYIANGKYIASFIGFAPYESPDYVVYVVVDEPKGAYYGGVVAAPIASKIFAEIFKLEQYLKQEPANTDVFELPTFIGMTLTEAAGEMSKLGLHICACTRWAKSFTAFTE